ncbi:acyl-CoA dehydrogenase family protein [Sphingosinicella sp. LHD-64]|uniref:acyl-CoA dehydrogenase family protein n=1 Tax=Sphingosinicella sp. LHD-64 TaxID=3072139 RepID=UPI0028106CA8|nr:acyl-CoA dehydrogenase family protein [Sphingosinicella sp. LHD-64]MDQ8757603.1 acyl-CoA dehydrogenase family protein [Sphingosinicella sp. LHD-64]
MDSDTFELLKTTVRRFVDERLVPNEDRLEAEDEVPAEIVQEMRELGLFGLSIPEDYGGLGLSMSEEAEIVFELGRTAFAFRSVIGTTVGIGSQGIVIDGTDEQKREWLPKLASGEAIASFALTEPNAGSDAASIQTSATRDGDVYRLNGTKRFITNAPRAGMFTVMARSEPGVAGAAGISAFILPADTSGITFGKPDRKMGQRGTITCDVIFDDVAVPAANIIGGVPGRGFKTAMKVLDRGRIHMSALAAGMSDRLVEESVRYAVERKQFGQAIGGFQLVQGMLADSRTDAFASRVMVADVARRFDAGEKVSADVAATKYFTTEAVGRVADRAVQIHGGAGYMADYKVERFYRDVRLLRIYEGTSQIQQVIIARSLLRDAGLAV